MIEARDGGLGVLGDVEVTVSARVGDARLPLSAVVTLAAGTVVPLECRADAPITLVVNGVAVAIGDLVTDDDGSLAFEIRETIA